MRNWFCSAVLAGVLALSLGAQVVPDGTDQPVSARVNQLADFPVDVQVVQSLGITPAIDSNAFWFDTPTAVGAVTVAVVTPGSSAAAAGLQAGDQIVQLRRIPHYRILLFLQDEDIQGGTVQLGFEIQRARSFSFSTITLHVVRSTTELDLVLSI